MAQRLACQGTGETGIARRQRRESRHIQWAAARQHAKQGGERGFAGG
jgi:hypothetical protein